MLNIISDIETVVNETAVNETAVKPLPRFGMGSCLRALIPSATPASTCAVAFARPRTSEAAGAMRLHSVMAVIGYQTDPQPSDEQFAHKTLISAFSGGAGPLHRCQPLSSFSSQRLSRL